MSSGIYCILNTANGKRYIGQSVNIKSRQIGHFSELRNDRHGNFRLQCAFKKHGAKAFKFLILEECPEDVLDLQERSWIFYYFATDRKYGYNLESGGHANKHHSAETKKKMSKSPGHRSVETRQKMLEAWKHRAPVSAETIQKTIATKRKNAEILEKILRPRLEEIRRARERADAVRYKEWALLRETRRLRHPGRRCKLEEKWLREVLTTLKKILSFRDSPVDAESARV